MKLKNQLKNLILYHFLCNLFIIEQIETQLLRTWYHKLSCLYSQFAPFHFPYYNLHTIEQFNEIENQLKNLTLFHFLCDFLSMSNWDPICSKPDTII